MLYPAEHRCLQASLALPKNTGGKSDGGGAWSFKSLDSSIPSLLITYDTVCSISERLLRSLQHRCHLYSGSNVLSGRPKSLLRPSKDFYVRLILLQHPVGVKLFARRLPGVVFCSTANAFCILLYITAILSWPGNQTAPSEQLPG